MLFHPDTDRRHRHILARDDAAFDQEASDRHVRLSILPIVADPNTTIVVQPDASGALYLQKEYIYRIIRPEEFEVTAGQPAIFDLAAGQVSAGADISRFAINRRLIGIMTCPRAIEFNFVIS